MNKTDSQPPSHPSPDVNSNAPTTEMVVASVVSQLRPCKEHHPQLRVDAKCFTYIGSSLIAGISCQGSLAAKVMDTDDAVANVLFMRKNDDGHFEDMLIPGARTAGCFIPVGDLTKTILIVEDYASGLSLHNATGRHVAVAMYSANLKLVGQSLRNKFPNANLIFCVGAYGYPATSNHSTIKLAAAMICARYVAPMHEGTFSDELVLHGAESVLQSVKSASKTVVESACETDKNLSSSLPDIFAKPAMWANPVVGAALMSSMIKSVNRFVVLPKPAVLTVCLWILLTHLLDTARVAPILSLFSPVRRCGKTTLLGLLERLVHRPLTSANITPAALYKSIAAFGPTIIVDEADTFLAKSEELIGIINAGHTRQSAYVMRASPGPIPLRFNTFCMKVVAGIGKQSTTITDRSIVIKHQRKRESEFVEKFNDKAATELAMLNAQIVRWAGDNLKSIENTAFKLPHLDINDRALDNWEPLLAIAHYMGPQWLKRATQAAIELSGRQRNDDCSGEELLRDIRIAFGNAGESRLSTEKLIAELSSDPEKPWASYEHRKAITPRQLSTLLRNFEIESKNLRICGAVLKGYEFDQFEDAFARYVDGALG